MSWFAEFKRAVNKLYIFKKWNFLADLCIYKLLDWGGKNLFLKGKGLEIPLSVSARRQSIRASISEPPLMVFALALSWDIMELEDFKQILRNHQTRPFFHGKFTDSGGEVRPLRIGMESCLNAGWYCAFTKTQAKILAISKTDYPKAQAQVLSGCFHAGKSSRISDWGKLWDDDIWPLALPKIQNPLL